MTPCCRALSALALLLVMLGLPVAPVVCELACPEAAAEVTSPAPHETMAAVHQAPPCHESAATQVRAESADTPVRSGMAEAPGHGCEHPSVLSSPRSVEGLRVPVPSPITWESSHHLSPSGAAHAVLASRAPSRVPWPPGATWSPVLRI